MVVSSIGKTKTLLDRKTGKMTTVAQDVNPLTKDIKTPDQGGTGAISQPTRVSQPKTTTQKATTPEPQQPIQQPGQFVGQPQTLEQPTIKKEMTEDGLVGLPKPEEQEEYIGKSKAEQQMEQVQRDKDKAAEEAAAKSAQYDAYTQAQTLEKTQRDKEYMAKQKELTDKQKELSEEISQQVSSQKIRTAQRSLLNLKQNVGYLGSQGRPGKSLEALEGMTEMLAEGQRVFKELKQHEAYAEEMRRLGYEFDANAYEKEMEDLQYRLDQQVTQSIQKIFDQMTADEIAGKLDTLEEVEELGARYYNMLDEEIASLTRKEYDMAMLKLQKADESLARVREVVANKNKRQVHPGGYYVDGNGTPLVDVQTGQPIQVPAEAPFEPVISADKSQMITFGYDENGNVVSTIHKLFDQEKAKTWDNTAISNIAQAVRDGDIEYEQAIKLIPEASQKDFARLYSQATSGGGGWNTQEGMRTDRHNNPTAFTTDIARQAGLVEGVDYVQGDPFPNNPNMFTARLLGDPIETTKRVIDSIGFYTQGGQQRRTHTAYSDEQWNAMTDDQKNAVIREMYRNEGGSGVLVGESPDVITEPEVAIVPELESFYRRYNSKETSKNRITKDERERIRKDYGLDSQQFAQQAIAWKKQQDKEVVPSLLELLDVLKQLRYYGEEQGRGEGKGMKKGEFLKLKTGLPGEGQDLQGLFDRAVASLGLNKLTDLKAEGATFGQLSNQELGFITDMSTNLRKWGRLGTFNKNLDKHIDIIEKGVEQVLGVSPQEGGQEGQTPQETQGLSQESKDYREAL